MTAWVPTPKRSMFLGADISWWEGDPFGRRLARKMLPIRVIDWKPFPHFCCWGIAQKVSTTHFIPPPRAVCAHGFVAPVRDDAEKES